MNRKGSAFKGSSNLLTSVAGQEVIPAKPAEWTQGYSFYKFIFTNKQVCHVKVNGSSESIFLDANQGFKTEDYDADITSFIIVEGAIQYSWIAYY